MFQIIRYPKRSYVPLNIGRNESLLSTGISIDGVRSYWQVFNKSRTRRRKHGEGMRMDIKRLKTVVL